MIRLLVIDDHPVTISGIKDILKDFAEIVYSSLNIRNSLNFDSSKFDIILLDLLMNGSDPIENVEILSKIYPNIPIVIFTCEDSVIWKRKMFDAGVSSYIVKTSSNSEIKLMLKDVFKNKNKIVENKKIKKFEYYFESLLQSMIEGVGIHEIVFDENKNPIDYMILDVNKSYENILGLKRENVKGKLASVVYGNVPALKEYSDIVINKKSSKFQFYYPKMKKYFDISASPWNDIGFISIFSDITENILLEQKYYNIFENINVGIFQIKDGIFITVNYAFAKILGYEISELINKKSTDFYYNKEDITILEKKLFKNGKVENFITMGVKKDGKIIWVSIDIIQIKDFDDIVVYNEGTMVDITDLKKSEELLNISETKYRRLFESAKDGILILDAETGKIMDVNPFLIEMLGYSKDNFLEKSIWEIGFFKDIISNKENFLELQNKEYIRYEDMPLETFNGIKINVEFISNVYLVNNSKVIQCNIRDTTEHVKEKKIRILSNEILSVLNSDADLKDIIMNVINLIQLKMNFSAVGIRIKDGDDFPYFIQNGFSDDFIFSENSIISKDDNGILCRDDNGKPLLECTCGFVISGKIDKINSLFVTKGGSAWSNDSYSLLQCENDPRFHPRNKCIYAGFSSVAIIPIKGNENIIGILQLNDKMKNMFTDKTIEFFEGIGEMVGVTLMRKQAENELLIAKEKAEKSDKMKMAFLANMSHDLRTPINSIIGFSELLKENNISKEEKLENLDVIIKNGDVLTTLVNDIIDISKIDSGMLKIQKSEIDLNKFLQDIKIQYSKQTINSKIKLNIDIDKNSNIFILTDKNRLEQILMNLLNNSIKFTKRGYIKFGYKILNDNKLKIYVKDTGVGISIEDQKYIFNRFFQINQPGTKTKGAGLGLSISNSLINLMGFGEIIFESKLGVGSEFYFIIPFILKREYSIIENKNKNNDINIDLTDLKILIVDDDPDVHKILIHYLKSTKSIVFTNFGKNINGVLNIIKDKKIDIVLLDLGLQNISGYDILKEIKDYKKSIKVIVQSAYVVSEFRNKSFEMGADGFVPKPINKNELLLTIMKQVKT